MLLPLYFPDFLLQPIRIPGFATLNTTLLSWESFVDGRVWREFWPLGGRSFWPSGSIFCGSESLYYRWIYCFRLVVCLSSGRWILFFLLLFWWLAWPLLQVNFTMGDSAAPPVCFCSPTPGTQIVPGRMPISDGRGVIPAVKLSYAEPGGSTKASTLIMFRDLRMNPFSLLLLFERLFLTSTFVHSTLSKRFALVSWLLAAVALPVMPPLRVVMSTALPLWVFTPVFTPPKAPPCPLPRPAPV